MKLLALAALLPLAPSLAKSPGEWTAASGLLPEQQGPGWGGWSNLPCGSPGATLGQGTLILDTSACAGDIQTFSYARTVSNQPLPSTRWMEAEVRVVAPLAPGSGQAVASLSLTPALICPFTLVLGDDEVRLVRFSSLLGSASIDTTSAVRTWRLEVDLPQLTSRVLADGQLVFAAAPPPPGPTCDFGPNYSGGISFGDSSSGDGGVSEWRAVRHSMGETWGTFCTFQALNSAGRRSETSWSGSLSVAANDFTLLTTGLPPNVFGYYLGSRGFQPPAPLGTGQGTLCLAGAIGRFNRPVEIQLSSGAGIALLQADLSLFPQPNGALQVLVGERWHFQLWHRDANPALTSNLSTGLHVIFE